MRPRPSNLMIFLAIVVALSPIRAAWQGCSVRTAYDGHVHVHVRTDVHRDHEHASALPHYHHHGETGHEDPSDHDRVLDHREQGPMSVWKAPRSITIDPVPAIAGAARVAPDLALGAAVPRSGRPPPLDPVRPRHESIPTTVLRL